MRRLAFSLAEVVAVAAIIILLAAITWPVFESAKRAAGKTVCISNLHQIGLAINIYSNSWSDEKVFYGPPSDMGLPAVFPDMARIHLISSGNLICRGTDPSGSDPRYTQMYPPPRDAINSSHYDEMMAEWNAYVTAQESNSVLISDQNHSDKQSVSQFVTHKCLGLFMDGSVRPRSGLGDPDQLDWWK